MDSLIANWSKSNHFQWGFFSVGRRLKSGKHAAMNYTKLIFTRQTVSQRLQPSAKINDANDLSSIACIN